MPRNTDVAVNGSRTIQALRHLAERLSVAADVALRETAYAVEHEATATRAWQDKTGKTRASIKARFIEGRHRAMVYAGGASHFLEGGTRAHPITGNPTLRFVVGGGTVVFRHTHPGTKATRFMQRARDHGERFAELAFALHIGATIGRA
jgi:hypothetical protein